MRPSDRYASASRSDSLWVEMHCFRMREAAAECPVSSSHSERMTHSSGLNSAISDLLIRERASMASEGYFLAMAVLTAERLDAPEYRGSGSPAASGLPVFQAPS